MELYDSLQVIAAADTAALRSLDGIKADISALDVEGQTYLFALVYYHCILNDLPPPSISDRVCLDLTTLSPLLLKILDKFIAMHKQRMSEQREMSHAMSSASGVVV